MYIYIYIYIHTYIYIYIYIHTYKGQAAPNARLPCQPKNNNVRQTHILL